MASQEEESGDQQRPVRHLLLTTAAPQLGTLLLFNYMFAQADQITVAV